MFTIDRDEGPGLQIVRGLGLRNGLLIGLALALGAWIPHALALIRYPVPGRLPGILLGSLALLILGGLGGWLATLLDSALVSCLIWIMVGLAMIWVVGHVPYELQSLIAWLADRRFWGLPIYAYNPAAQYFSVMAGFFVVLLLAVLGLLQSYRLEGLRAEVEPNGRLTGRAWFALLLPLPFLIGVGLVADNLINAPLRAAPGQVHEAIRTGRTYSGDLFELSLQDGINYNAMRGVRDQMSANYSLSIGEFDLSAAKTVMVVTYFDNGAWINCRVINGNISHCYDAGQPYLLGFPSLLTSGALPEDCLLCTVKMDDEQADWLQARRDNWTGPPRVTRLAQYGSYVLVQASSPDGNYALECMFNGIEPVRLESCWETGAFAP